MFNMLISSVIPPLCVCMYVSLCTWVHVCVHMYMCVVKFNHGARHGLKGF